MVEAYDRQIAAVNEQVGGIVQLGQLNKRDLYRALASASAPLPAAASTVARSTWAIADCGASRTMRSLSRSARASAAARVMKRLRGREQA
jgi:hypothetical protein